MFTPFFPPPHHEGHASLVDLQHVRVVYDQTVALDDITLQINPGEQIAVVGPNGAGKSTLFQVIAGLLRATNGRVRIGGSEPSRHICVGYVPQRNRIDWRFPVSVSDVVMMGRVGKIGLFRWPSRHDRALVAAALDQVGMSSFAGRQIGELSGGQQQRVFLARVLAQESELLLMDEPLSGLDLPSQEAILSTLDGLRRQQITILVATHDLNQAAEHFDRLLLLKRRVVAFGSPAEVLTTENLMTAYGSGLQRIASPQGEWMMTDGCCDAATVEPVIF